MPNATATLHSALADAERRDQRVDQLGGDALAVRRRDDRAEQERERVVVDRGDDVAGANPGAQAQARSCAAATLASPADATPAQALDAKGEHRHRRRLALAQREQAGSGARAIAGDAAGRCRIDRVESLRCVSARRRRSIAKRTRRQPLAAASSSRPMTSSAPRRSQPGACSASGSTTTMTSAARSAIAADLVGRAGDVVAVDHDGIEGDRRRQGARPLRPSRRRSR